MCNYIYLCHVNVLVFSLLVDVHSKLTFDTFWFCAICSTSCRYFLDTNVLKIQPLHMRLLLRNMNSGQVHVNNVWALHAKMDPSKLLLYKINRKQQILSSNYYIQHTHHNLKTHSLKFLFSFHHCMCFCVHMTVLSMTIPHLLLFS